MRILFYCLVLLLTILSCKQENDYPLFGDYDFELVPDSVNLLYKIFIHTEDADGDSLSLIWSCEYGHFLSDSMQNPIIWLAPRYRSVERFHFTIKVNDGQHFVKRQLVLKLALPEYSVIEGYVFFKGTRIPVSKAQVICDIFETSTDDSGYFKFDTVAPGVNRLTMKSLGYAPVDTLVYCPPDQILSIETSSPENESMLRGKIQDSQNAKPVEDFMIYILNNDWTENQLVTLTDQQGQYSIGKIPKGKRRIVGRYNDYTYFNIEIELTGTENEFNFTLPEVDLFTDPRDGKKYGIKEIGSQIWMTDNLAFIPLDFKNNSLWLYGLKDQKNIHQTHHEKMGLLYIGGIANQVCPEGWHLPSDKEWMELEKFLGMNDEELEVWKMRNSGEVGQKLKSSYAWANSGSGDDLLGFNALPVGSNAFRRESPGGFPFDLYFNGLGEMTSFWCNDTLDPWGSFYASPIRKISNSSAGIYRGYVKWVSYASSIRCIKDDGL